MYQGHNLTPLTPYTGYNPLGFDWDRFFENVITTAGQVIAPGSPSAQPTYNPGSTSVGRIGTSSGPWILGFGALALVLFMRKR